MNPNQLSTLEEAKAIAAKVGAIGGGVDDIYVPEVGPFALSANGPAKFHHFRFKNGAEGFNVGLIRMFMQLFPSRWPLMLATEVDNAEKFRLTS
jgi:hypothetical protein